MNAAAELVVLLDEDGRAIGTAPKATVHGSSTPLHLAFSCHVRDENDRILVTRRALDKATWPGVWTNSFCGHPGPGEDPADAVLRRGRQELGLELDDLQMVLPDFRYRAIDANGIVENELCPVYTARIRSEITADPDEVMDWAWVEPASLAESARLTPFAFSPWLVLQLPALGLAGD